MKQKLLYSLCVLLSLLFVSCGDDEYDYPPVKLEFLTALSDETGYLKTLITDQGERYTIAKDRSNSQIKPNSSVRIVSNYEVLSHEKNAAEIYALLKPISVEPKPETDPVFNDGVETDPVDMTSIWMGRDYLNLILSIKMQDGKHTFHFVEEQIENTESSKTITILLFHNANGDPESFSKRAYLSIPLKQYYNVTEDEDKEIIIKFKYWSRDRLGEKVLIEKYANTGFVYIPSND